MNTSRPERSFEVSVRIKQHCPQPGGSALGSSVPRLPRLRPCEVAGAAGLDAVRRALHDLLGENGAA